MLPSVKELFTSPSRLVLYFAILSIITPTAACVIEGGFSGSHVLMDDTTYTVLPFYMSHSTLINFCILNPQVLFFSSKAVKKPCQYMIP